MNLKIEYIPVKEIEPYKNNAKLHPDEQIGQIKRSIEEFGFNDPIAVWHGTVVEGHGRLIAAQELGMETVPVIRLDGLSDEQRRAYTLIHNKLTMNSGFDVELLGFELDSLPDFDADFYGFDPLADEEEEREIVEDETPAPPEESKTKLGDLFDMGGRHRLICGDSTDPAVIDRLMDGVKANMVFTDPPYGYNYQSNMRTQSDKFEVLENDDKILDFFSSTKNAFNGFIYVCTTWKTADKWIELFKNYYKLTNVIIWDKGGGGIGDLFHTFSTDYEMILVCNNGQELRGKRYGSVWNFTNTEISKMKKEELLKIVLEQKEYYSIWKQKKDNSNEYVHPTQKPVALSAKAIRSSTDFDEIVLDVFGGSGSTLIACEQLNRKCYICELDPRYCDVIIKRWENFTGEKAVKISGD